MEKPYVISRQVGKRVTIYGPFETADAARHAGFFNRSVELRDAFKFEDWRYIEAGIQYYNDDEIQSLLAAPKDMGYSKVTHKPARACPMHPSWKKVLKGDWTAERAFRYFYTGKWV